VGGKPPGQRGTDFVKVAYVFSASGHTASYKLGKMILPQLEEGRHGVEVVGMMFFDDNTYVLRKGDPSGERLDKIARENGMLLVLCDQCALERGLAEGELGNCAPVNTVEGVRIGQRPTRPHHHALVCARFSAGLAGWTGSARSVTADSARRLSWREP
jgi:hypothetical protein